jgi:adenylyltransferase/sulfurtransferase
MQAIEAVKMIVGIRRTAVSRLMHFDALKMKFREFRVREDPGCRSAARSPTITELIDYDQFCGIPQAQAAEEAEPRCRDVR